MPPWLAELARPAPGPVPWARMAHAALAVCAPLGLGIAVRQPVLGLLTGMGGLLSAVVDPGGPYLVRARRIGVAAVAGAAAGLLVGTRAAGHGWLTIAVLTLVAGISAVLSAAGNVASVTGLQLLVYSILGTGPLRIIQPWWVPPVAVIAGAAWGIVLLAPIWLLAPLAPEQRAVAATYRALAGLLRATGTSGYEASRRQLTGALNGAYDGLVARRAASAGRDPAQVRLVALLSQTHALAEAATTVAEEGHRPSPETAALLDDVAATIAGTGPAPAPASFDAVISGRPAAPGERALREAVAGLRDLVTGSRQPDPGDRAAVTGSVPARGRWQQRLREAATGLAGGRLAEIFALRVMASVFVAAVISEFAPLQRSYWILLTTAIVLRPDFGSVFARGVQRGVGTVIGAVAGAAILVTVPYGSLLLLPCAVLAALLPYGRSRNYGLFAVFLTPLVVVLIDLLTRSGWLLAEDRLIDTLIGCAVALLIGYAPWPGAWHAHLPGQFANAVDKVSRYTEQALASRSPGRSPQRRQTYRALSDLRTEFQRTMAEPPAISRQAVRLWPALVALEKVMDKVTATAVRVDVGEQPPAADEVAEVTAALTAISAALAAGTRPPALPVPSAGSPAVRPVAGAVRDVQRALAPGTGAGG